MKRSLNQVILISLLFWITGCYTVPKTGRSSLSLVSEERLASMAEIEFNHIKLESRISYDPVHNERVKRVGKRIAKAAEKDIPNVDWEFVVFEDDEQINAFAMPGGKVAVYTGLLKFAQTDDELAIVIGHEAAHVAARHSNERFSQEMLKSGFLNAGTIALSGSGIGHTESQILLAVVGAGTDLGLVLPFSRKHENEADKIGLLYAAEAGYDPHAAIQFWERLESLGDEKPPAFLSTHPSGETRIRKLWTQMPEAVRVYENQ